MQFLLLSGLVLKQNETTLSRSLGATMKKALVAIALGIFSGIALGEPATGWLTTFQTGGPWRAGFAFPGCRR